MKILIITSHLNVGGISSYIINLTKGLKQKGIDVVIASSGGDVIKNLEDLGARHFFIDIDTSSELSPKIIKCAISLSKLARQEKFDIIHAQTRVTQVLAALFSGISGISYISTCHGFYKFRLNRKIFPCFGKFVIAVSRQVKEELKNKLYIKEGRIKLIPHGIDIEKYSKNLSQVEKIRLREQLNLKPGSFVLGNIGRLSWEKGHKFLISAFSEVVKKHPDTELIIVGKGRLEQDFLAQVKNLGIENKVYFFGERRDLENIYPVMDIFCFPSLRESFGFSVLEALASGVPVIASDIGELRYLVEDGRNGFLCKPGDSKGLTLKINYLIENKNSLDQMKKEARSIASKDFSLLRMADDVISVYEQAIKTK
ncbi:MAG: glycosyltransferase family 4 protein [Candidatus Omnitrophota bacterium]